MKKTEGDYLYSGTGTDEKKPERLINKIRRSNDRASLYKSGSKIAHRSFCYRSVRIETFSHKKNATDKAILLLHGGAFIRGNDDFYRLIATHLVNKTGATVYLPDYSVMPKAYPVQANEIECVWEYITENRHPRNIVVMGAGAGGNLALGMVQKLVQKRMLKPSAMVLIAPWIDMTVSGDSYYDKFYLDKVLGDYVVDEPDLTDTIKKNEVFDYLKGWSRNDPNVSPIFGSMYSLPPTLICTGDYSVLLSDSELLYGAMQNAGVEVEFISEVGKIGEYPLFYDTDKKANKAMKRICKFISSHLINDDTAEGL